MLYLFDKRRELLVQEYIPEFRAMNHEDIIEFQRHEGDENVTNKRKRNLTNERTGIRKLMKQLVDAIQPSRSGISHNSTVKIDEEGAITYKVVLDYIASKMNVAYAENDSTE